MAAFAISTAARSSENTIALTGPAPSGDVVGHVSYLLDATRALTLEDVRQAAAAGQFTPVAGKSVDFGYTKSMIWLRFSTANGTRSESDWRLYFRENFMQVFEVHRIDADGSARTLIAQDEQSAFSSRPVPYPELVVPFDLEPGSTATFFVRYWSGGSSELSFSIETAQSFEDIATGRSARNFIYYGMIVLLTALALAALAATRHPVFLCYAGYSGSALLFTMHADGNGFKCLWPNSPAFNGVATIVFGSGIIIFGALFARVFLRTRRFHPLMDKLLAGAMYVTIAMLVATAFADNQAIKKTLVLVAFLSILLFTASGIVAARKRFKEVRFYVVAWSGAVISSAIMTARHWLGIEISEEVQYDSIRIVMVSDATLMGLAIWDRINQLRAANTLALRESLDQARRNLQITERLQELEKHYATVLDLVANKDRQIADTFHDLRQPLHALRLNVRNLTSGTAAADGGAGDVEQTLAYLEQLVAEQLERSRQTEHAPGPIELRHPSTELLSTNDVLRGVHEMFLPDARAKDLRFTYVPTSAQAQIDPLVLMRIVTNLVANAITYTQKGRVLLGVRRRDGRLRVEVHDTGPGMTAVEFGEACKREVRLDKTRDLAEGMGYGLSIVSSLARKHDLAVSVAPGRSGGTGVIVEVPAGN
jgi:signal transduction histidine kinase